MKNDLTLLFDLDGTLTDTLRDLGECVNEVLSAHGLPVHPLDAYRLFVGDGMRKLIERALGEACTPARLEELLKEFVPLYDRQCLRYVSLYPGIAETVAELKARGVKLAVVTNKPEPQAQKIVAHLFPADTFTVVHGNVPGRPTKPDRTVVDLTLRELDADPSCTLFVGDSDVDVLTAQNAA
ncbi:MAG: HAD-IA family hydrolase, partial [Clostridia bacterium]|nr:HAD-IA family hydrolase [Clostridia bacterium]